MIVHHEQTIEMAALAEDRADADEVLSLATRIGEAQQPEIDRMQECLEAWGEDAADAGTDMGHDGVGMGGGDSMGMMSGEDMEQLEGASGGDFGRMFLAMMHEHHRGALAMAQDVQANGPQPQRTAPADDGAHDTLAGVAESKQPN